MPLFTAATAREAALRSHAPTSARFKQPEPEPQPAPSPQAAEIADDFTVRKLARVREQIDSVEKLLDAATEPQAVDRFANALTRLYDLERILAGRPLPGSRRPTEDRAPRRQPRTEPAYPAPVVLPAPAPDTPTGSVPPTA